LGRVIVRDEECRATAITYRSARRHVRATVLICYMCRATISEKCVHYRIQQASKAGAQGARARPAASILL